MVLEEHHRHISIWWGKVEKNLDTFPDSGGKVEKVLDTFPSVWGKVKKV